MKKMFFVPRKAETLAKNELKTVKVTSQQALLATLNDVTGAPHGMLAPPDSHFNSRGLEVPSGGRGGYYS